MNISMHDSARAEILTNALPYMQKYAGKVIVVKYGGNAMTSPELKVAVMNDIILLSQVGIRVVLVHGGGPEINEMLDRLSIPSVFKDGLRCTDEEVMKVVQMVLAGKTNKDLVALIGSLGGKAIGLCGLDGGMLKAKKHTGADLGFVGDIVSVDPTPIFNTLSEGYIPVIASLGVDGEGQTYNINADTAAAEIAVAVEAENILTLSNIKGLLLNPQDDSTLLPSIKIGEIEELIGKGVISGGMIPKVLGLKDAIERGVKKAVLIDGRIPHSLIIEMFSNGGIGTMFTGENT